MIGAAMSALTRLGLIEAGCRPHFTLAISRGSTITAEVSIDPDQFLHIKGSAHASLRAEYVATLRAAAVHRSTVPRPVAHVVEGGWELLFSEGRRFSTMDAGQLHSSMVSRALLQFLEHSALNAAPASAGRHVAFVRRSLQTSSTPIPDGLIRHWTAGAGARVLDSLTTVAQHGDFTVNNIGITRAGLVVFDWADFGAVEIPGFDLATLLLSMTDFEPARVLPLLTGTDRSLVLFTESACKRLSLPYPAFRTLLPLYLAIFLSLKSQFATGIRHKVATALAHVSNAAITH
jgi:hypothetical protein